MMKKQPGHSTWHKAAGKIFDEAVAAAKRDRRAGAAVEQRVMLLHWKEGRVVQGTLVGQEGLPAPEVIRAAARAGKADGVLLVTEGWRLGPKGERVGEILVVSLECRDGYRKSVVALIDPNGRVGRNFCGGEGLALGGRYARFFGEREASMRADDRGSLSE